MHETSEKYKQILLSDEYRYETSLVIGEAGRLITERNEVIRFGGDGILISSGNGDSGYGEHMLVEVTTKHSLFKEDKPTIGSCACGELYVEMHMPVGDIPPMAMISPYVRLVSRLDPNVYSEWFHKGIYFIDTRENTKNDDDLDILTIHAYDAMLKAEIMFPGSDDWQGTDIDAVEQIASILEVSLDPDSRAKINKGYPINVPFEYTVREVLGFIGSMYAGNWIISDDGMLRLVCLNELPEETSLLLEEHGFYLTFGGDRILI